MNTLHITTMSGIALGLLLVVAVANDIQHKRIPNKIIIVGLSLGILLNAFLPAGWGMFSTLPGGLGMFGAVIGICLGLGIMLIPYFLRFMGAGDVKLMAMVGAFLGPGDVLGAILFTFAAGGVLAVAVALQRGVLRRVFSNIGDAAYIGVARISTGSLPRGDDLPATAAKLPYAVAIAVGTVSYLLAKQLGWFSIGI